MRLYLISYDLRSQGHDYTDLYAAIKNVGDWQHPLEAVWVIDSDFDSDQIYHKLKGFIKEGDRLVIMNINPQDIQGWLSRTFWQWLREKMGL